jgi:hypothetical protein
MLKILIGLIVMTCLFSTHVESTNLSPALTSVNPLQPASFLSFPSIVLGTSNSADTLLYQNAKSILSVAFKKLGYRLEIKVLPNKRSLSWASHGIIDGELFRIKTLNLDNSPILQQVKDHFLLLVRWC